MSLMGMNRIVKKYGAYIGGVAALLMLIVSLSGLGNNLTRGGAGGNTPAANAATAEKPVATVGGEALTRSQLDQILGQELQGQRQPPPPPAQMDDYRYQTLNTFKQKAALIAAAKAANVTVSETDIAREREKAWTMMRPQVAQVLNLPPTATDAELEKAMSAQQPGLTLAAFKGRISDDDVRTSLYRDGLLASFKKQVKVSEADVKRSYDEIQVRHILVKSGDGGLPDAQAKTKAEKILAQVKANPASMADLAKQFSDDPGSKNKGGFYDWAPASQYVPEFTQAALDAGVGKVNPALAKTSFGYHIIKLEGERSTVAKPAPPTIPGMPPTPTAGLPADWDKNKQKYIDDYSQKIAIQKATEALKAQVPNIKVDVTDPGLKAAQLEDEARTATDEKARKAKLADALAQLDKADKTQDKAGILPLRRAALLGELDRNPEAIAAYTDALKYRNTVDTHLALADLYVKQKDNASAIKQLEEAQKLPASDIQTAYKIAFAYKNAGDAAKSKAAMAKAADLIKRQREMDEADRKAQAAATSIPLSPGKTGNGIRVVPPGGVQPVPGVKPAPAVAASPAPSGSPSPVASPVAASPAPPVAPTR